MNMQVPPQLNHQVLRALQDYLERTAKGSLRSLEVRHIVQRPFSLVVFYRGHTYRGTYDAVLKKVVHHPVNIALTSRENQAEVEFASLAKLYPKFCQDNHCSVPEPIAVFPEHEAYLMEYVVGDLLMEKFRAARYFSRSKDFSSLKKWYFFCGKWLRKFQRITAEAPRSGAVFSETMRRCEEKLEIISASKDPRCPAGFKERVLRDLQKELGLIQDDTVMTAGRHGDFGGWNIIANEEGVTVFDFLGSQPDSVAVDILKMLINLYDEKTYIFYSKRRINDLEKSFLEGYGEIPIIQKSVAVICETLHRVCSLSACVSGCSSNKLLSMRKIESNKKLKQHILWLMSENKEMLWPNSKLI